MHNLKHNKVLHEKNVILTVETAETPRVPEKDRVSLETINADFRRLTVRYGFMEQPNVPKALGPVPQAGAEVRHHVTSFFLGGARWWPAPPAACRSGRTSCSSSC
jgi:KUP system potassium uptake protein